MSYTGSVNIVYFNMQGNRTLRLAGDSYGAGILLVEGSLEIDGNFTWYGVILTTGAVGFTGSGQKNVTGGILSGGNATVEVGGNTGVFYCSEVSKKLEEIIPSTKTTRWREIF